MTTSRRQFLKSTGLGLFAYTVGNRLLWLTPAQARSRDLPHQLLTENETSTLERVGDILLPGAGDAGLTHFIDQQLATPAEECLLMLKYLDVNPPFSDFYRTAVAAIDKSSRALYKKPFSEIDHGQAVSLVTSMGAANPEGWQGPPAPLFYFTLRSDAIDVVYGTEQGFKKLDIPYLAHINPEQDW